jgi:hypothetical protein
MSDKLQVMEAEWLSKLAAMRDAISKLNIPKEEPPQGELYGYDLGLSDDDFSYPSGSDDIWDLISDDTDYSSDHEPHHQLDDSFASSAVVEQQYDRNWLARRSAGVASRTSGFDADALTDQILAILSSDSSGMP